MEIAKKILLHTILTIVLLGCQEVQLDPNNFPVALMKQVAPTEKGVTFLADILYKNKNEIKSYGFVWAEHNDPRIDIDQTIFKFSEVPKKEFSATIESGLAVDVHYYVRPFIITDSNIIYGNYLSFLSNGSLSPSILKATPPEGKNDDQIHLTGENFGYAGKNIVVKYGANPLNGIDQLVDSSDNNNIYFRLKSPTTFKSNDMKIFVETGDMSDEIDLRLIYPWNKIMNYSLDIPRNVAVFVINEVVYLIAPNSSICNKVNLKTNTWSEISLPELSGPSPITMSLGDETYILLENNFWRYSVLSSWEKRAPFPEIITNPLHVFNMSILDKGYIGFNYGSMNVWSYIPSANQWSQVSDFPVSFSDEKAFTFSVNERAYVGSSTHKEFWEFEPVANSWVKKTPYPEPSSRSSYFANFTIDNEIYLGVIRYREFYKYNQTNDIWQANLSFPNQVALNPIASFNIGNKGYVFFHKTFFNITYKEIWEFDTSKL